MRIALFSDTYVPYINGVVEHVKNLKQGLEHFGHEVLVVTASNDEKDFVIRDGVLYCPVRLKARGIYNYPIFEPFLFTDTKLKYIMDFAPDIVHIHTEFGIGELGRMAAARLNIPVVYTIHTIYNNDYLNCYLPTKLLIKPSKSMLYKVIKRYAEHADAITGPSEKSHEFLREVGLEKEMAVIPNPVNLESFDRAKISEEAREAFRAHYNIPKDAFVACFVGRLGIEKGVDTMLKLLADKIVPQDNFHLVLFGDGPVKDELEYLAAELGIGPMVTFTGMLPNEKLPSCLSACDTYITCSLSDTNSISMLEAMAMGLPVLHLYDEINKDQVTDGVNGYFFRSADELYERIKLLQGMTPDEFEQFRSTTIQSVQSKGPDALARHLLDIYEPLVESEENNNSQPRRSLVKKGSDIIANSLSEFYNKLSGQ
ncbi:glycosyltransferase [Candidatus Soleaferrea massiliensis]|uniref:glycosyltransferase n=1 Tax=Candidatus Soleaferrea massiliensis TaxID=1470354 RepID=UPI000694A17B|nr:glycosyltransferase [Candidatus Soleaferrea massiliensis]